MQKTENKITVQLNKINLYSSHITVVIVYAKQQKLVFAQMCNGLICYMCKLLRISFITFTFFNI